MRHAELIERLDPSVAERVRPLTDREAVATGEYVLYWMHHAVRGHENPALDAARACAAALDLPLLAYQGLGGGHRFDNDRHHTFILEGARDVQRELAERGISYAFRLSSAPAAPSGLEALTPNAALIVTEDFPAPPFPRWMRKLAGTSRAPVWAIDTACIVPMQLVERAHDRAFRFRDAITDLLEDRLERPWPDSSIEARPYDLAGLPFASVDLGSADLAELVARCPIDHTVGPVAHTRGGSVAGYGRWHRFRDERLSTYAARRNDAADDGVSRLSPYLHHGHVSPFRLAREIAAQPGKGPRKFLDELIVWRELAHNLCFHRHASVESLDVLPDWARMALQEQAGDARSEMSPEALARGRTGDRLWDLCQTSLMRHGELHNNVRMTWGKAIPAWTTDPETALATLIELNHRFALDGSDPNSYGGLLWCLGLFDRPFEPAKPVLGTVRGRSTISHARRLDLDRYAESVTAPASGQALEVAVIGAGISGLSCARTLQDHGHRVEVFDKGRGPGGRMSTRRTPEAGLDHGAQYFTVRDPRFGRWVESWRQQGLVAPWQGRIARVEHGEVTYKPDGPERLVGTPGMSSICAHLAAELTVSYRTRVARLAHEANRWQLTAENGRVLGGFDAVVVSAPAPQTAALTRACAPGLASRAASAEIAPCWAVLATPSGALDPDFDGAFVHGSPLGWVAHNGSKPGRDDDGSWILHATPDWSREHLERERDEIAELLAEAFREALAKPSITFDRLAAHRWRFALPTQPLAEECLFDPDLALAACGDWCGGPRVEGAFLSGCAAAGRILSLAGQR